MRCMSRAFLLLVAILAAGCLAAGCGSSVKSAISSVTSKAATAASSAAGGAAPTATATPTVTATAAPTATPTAAPSTATATVTATATATATAPAAPVTSPTSATSPGTAASGSGRNLIWLWILLGVLVLGGLIALIARSGRRRSAAAAGWQSRLIDAYAKGSALHDAMSVAEGQGDLTTSDARARWFDIQRRADDLAQTLYALHEAAPDPGD